MKRNKVKIPFLSESPFKINIWSPQILNYFTIISLCRAQLENVNAEET